MTPNLSTSHIDRDVFRPSQDPARAIYDAFQAEAAKRKGRALGEWVAKDRLAHRH